MIKAGGRTSCSHIHKLINSIRNTEQLPKQCKESIIVPIYKKDDKTDGSNCRSIITFVYYVQNFIQHPAVKFNSICGGNYWGSSVWILTKQVSH
jgi:hypothetical protein